MDPIEKTQRRAEAQRRLRAQRQRVGQLRGRVIAISLIAFVLLWGVVFAQMVAGNDPVLGAGSRPTASKIASETIETSAPEEVEAEVVEPEPAPVTTSQS